MSRFGVGQSNNFRMDHDLGESRNSNLSLGQTIKSHNFNRSTVNKLMLHSRSPQVTKKQFADDQSGFQRPDNLIHTAQRPRKDATEVSTRTEDIYMDIK